MFKRILIAIDGAPATTAALTLATHLARQSQAVLTGIFIIDDRWADFIGHDWQSTAQSRQAFLNYIQDEQIRQAQQAQACFAIAVNSEQITDSCFIIEVGDPSALLIERAQSAYTDLLILSRQVFAEIGRPSIKTLIATVTKRAQCPVLLVP